MAKKRKSSIADTCGTCGKQTLCTWHGFKSRFLCSDCWDLPTRIRVNNLIAENRQPDTEQKPLTPVKRPVMSHPMMTDETIITDYTTKHDPSPPKPYSTFRMKKKRKPPPPHPDAR